MSIKTNVKVWATSLAILATLGAYYTISDTRDDSDVTLHVSFDATTSRPTITVQLSTTPPLSYHPGGTGEWERITRIPPGMRVILAVTQETRGYTECWISQHGHMAMGSPDGMNGPGHIACQHVAE